ncbi:hypothetical protein [Syntrophomonas palmitatica]|uniref:hypothetical protein n=1 Tax=Syntrophomonas palmitatica TaxID=402877 RepID=UPI0006D06D70|nr:hypothetical protein [Syntrophomonas palmitatica]
MFTIERAKAAAETKTAEVQVKTRKYRAVALKNIKIEEGPCLCTAKKTSVPMNDFCSECGSAEKRQRIKKCPRCGDALCPECWQGHKGCLSDDDED